MFSGIVETLSKVLEVLPARQDEQIIRFNIERPSDYNDLKIGDSICINGICLTIESFTEKSIQFCLGSETLSMMNQQFDQWIKYPLNIERSLKFGDRVHGHLVTGHVDHLAKIHKTYQDGECWQIEIEISNEFKTFFWKKGSVCLNGVSLTINSIHQNILSVCLIPETIKATNLTYFNEGHYLTVESDYLAKAYFNLKVKDQ